MSTQKILMGTDSSTIVSYPRVNEGANPAVEQVSTATVRVYTPAVSPATVSTWQTASVDNFSVAMSACDEGDTTLVMTTGTQQWIKGRTYLLFDSSGGNLLQIIESAKNLTSATLTLKSPLTVSAATPVVYGWAVYLELTEQQTATAGECTAIWNAVSGSGSSIYQWAQSFQIVKRMPVVSLTPARLASDYPVILSFRDDADISLERVIDSAWRNDVLPLLHANGIVEENIISMEELEPLHAMACLLSVARQRPDTDEAFYNRINDRYTQLKETTLASTSWYEVSQQLDPPTMKPENAPQKQGNGFKVSR
jgi:hypothetical protein